MPNRWAIQNGNWSDPTTWSGSLIPTSADDVFANNRTVNVDTSFEVLSLSSAASGSGVITAGGSFVFLSGSISASLTSTTPIQHPAIGSIATNLIQVTSNTGVVSINFGGDIRGASAVTTNLILHSGTCDLILSASSFTGGPSVAANNSVCINKSSTSTGTTTIIGNVRGGSNNSNQGLVAAAGTVIITGSVRGGTAGTAVGINQSGGTLSILGDVLAPTNNDSIVFSGTQLNIIGNVTGGSVSPAISTTAPITVNGNVFGSGSAGISSTSPISIIVTGSVTGGTGSAGISTTTSPLLIVSGACIAANQPAVINTNASALNIFTGPFTNVSGTMAIQCINAVLTQDASTTWDFGNTILYSPEQLAYYPSASDIRQGVTYADGTVSGSLAMPPPTAVIAGTPTDNTTGSAVLTPEQLQDAVWGRDLSQMTETGSIGARLAKSATLDSTGNQLASYLI